MAQVACLGVHMLPGRRYDISTILPAAPWRLTCTARRPANACDEPAKGHKAWVLLDKNAVLHLNLGAGMS